MAGGHRFFYATIFRLPSHIFVERTYKGELYIMSMHTESIKSRRLFPLAGVIVLVLVFGLVACGTNTTATGSPSGNGAPAQTPAPTVTPGQSSANGCPDSAVVTTQPAPAGVVLTSKNTGNTVRATRGETVEVDLPFGHAWSGPVNFSQGLLSMQTPAGYESSSAHACVWRFTATGTGTAHLSFVGRPICKKGQACPMYIQALDFTVAIQ